MLKLHFGLQGGLQSLSCLQEGREEGFSIKVPTNGPATVPPRGASSLPTTPPTLPHMLQGSPAARGADFLFPPPAYHWGITLCVVDTSLA